MDRPHAIIIGAGFTGCATAHDLALRGFEVTVLERGEIASGTSGRTHGLLHSGGRYCVDDPESAVECIDENQVLRQIAGQCIEPNGGLFVALDERDLEYEPAFLQGAQACHIPVESLTPHKALEMEPQLNPRLLAAYLVPDGAFDPLRLALAFAATARSNGARFRLYSEVESLLLDGKGDVTGVRYWDRATGAHTMLHGDVVVNATGAWAGELASMAGASVPVQPTPGIMVAFTNRLVQRCINRLAIPGDGDIVVPQRRMVIVGTTSYASEELDYIPVERDQIQEMIARGAELIPQIRNQTVRGVFTATRPLIGNGTNARSISRTFKCIDHETHDGVCGLVTITGGKATTCRAMAEKTADVVCQKLGVRSSCQTREAPLLSYRQFYQPSIQGGGR